MLRKSEKELLVEIAQALALARHGTGPAWHGTGPAWHWPGMALAWHWPDMAWHWPDLFVAAVEYRDTIGRERNRLLIQELGPQPLQHGTGQVRTVPACRTSVCVAMRCPQCVQAFGLSAVVNRYITVRPRATPRRAAPRRVRFDYVFGHSRHRLPPVRSSQRRMLRMAQRGHRWSATVERLPQCSVAL